jgi:hypothetical protein
MQTREWVELRRFLNRLAKYVRQFERKPNAMQARSAGGLICVNELYDREVKFGTTSPEIETWTGFVDLNPISSGSSD